MVKTDIVFAANHSDYYYLQLMILWLDSNFTDVGSKVYRLSITCCSAR